MHSTRVTKLAVIERNLSLLIPFLVVKLLMNKALSKVFSLICTDRIIESRHRLHAEVNQLLDSISIQFYDKFGMCRKEWKERDVGRNVLKSPLYTHLPYYLVMNFKNVSCLIIKSFIWNVTSQWLWVLCDLLY